jgi:hypothetical protein
MRKIFSYSILDHSERPPYDLHRRGHRPMHRPHLPIQSQNRQFWLQAQLQARLQESNLWVPVGYESASVDRYIYGTSVKRLGSVLHQVYVAYNVPHVLHALCSRWPCATTFEVLASQREAIYRCYIPISVVQSREKQHVKEGGGY